jgi:hypothetical protein
MEDIRANYYEVLDKNKVKQSNISLQTLLLYEHISNTNISNKNTH